MPYIVKSSLEIESTIVPWNKHENEKLIKEKKEYLKKKQEETEHLAENTKTLEIKEKNIEKPKQEEPESETEVIKETKTFKTDRRNQKAGEK